MLHLVSKILLLAESQSSCGVQGQPSGALNCILESTSLPAGKYVTMLWFCMYMQRSASWQIPWDTCLGLQGERLKYVLCILCRWLILKDSPELWKWQGRQRGASSCGCDPIVPFSGDHQMLSARQDPVSVKTTTSRLVEVFCCWTGCLTLRMSDMKKEDKTNCLALVSAFSLSMHEDELLISSQLCPIVFYLRQRALSCHSNRIHASQKTARGTWFWAWTPSCNRRFSYLSASRAVKSQDVVIFGLRCLETTAEKYFF